MSGQNTHWESDWADRLISSVDSLGYKSLSAYLIDHPTKTYSQISKELGDFASIQIQMFQMREASTDNLLFEAIADSLVRSVWERLIDGWGNTPDNDYAKAGVFADWMTTLRFAFDRDAIHPTATKAWNDLKDANPPEGWLPMSPSDAIISNSITPFRELLK